MIVMMIKFLASYFRNSAKKRLNFIIEAQKSGNFVPAKLTCLTREGYYREPHYNAEYMYVVDDKRYFVTYQMHVNTILDSAKDEFDADMLATQIKKYMILFYDAKNPQKVMCKAEAFVSEYVMHQIYSNQNHNIYRDVNKDWTEAIDLVSFH
jgi:hypothetical protein